MATRGGRAIFSRFISPELTVIDSRPPLSLYYYLCLIARIHTIPRVKHFQQALLNYYFFKLEVRVLYTPNPAQEKHSLVEAAALLATFKNPLRA